MRKLEQLAHAAWVIGGDEVRELVALGFEDPEDECITWFELPNQAGVGEFYIDASDVQSVLSAAQASGLDPRSTRILWHSHYRSTEPSEADYQLLRDQDWIDFGVVFHAPSQTSTVYNSAGIIPNNASNVPELATPEASHG